MLRSRLALLLLGVLIGLALAVAGEALRGESGGHRTVRGVLTDLSADGDAACITIEGNERVCAGVAVDRGVDLPQVGTEVEARSMDLPVSRGDSRETFFIYMMPR